MAYLKIYEWERETYPAFREVNLCKTDQQALVKKLARHFKVKEPKLGQSFKRGFGAGSYQVNFTDGHIIKTHETAPLSTLLHEFAHHLAEQRYKGRQGHNKNFKRELKKVYTWGKRYLPKEGIK